MKRIFIVALLLLASAILINSQTKSERSKEGRMSEQEFEEVLRKAEELTAAQFAKPQVLYYSPVVNLSGQNIAYVKRTVDYSVKGGGLIPFLGPAPEVKVKSDLIELCQRNIANGEETVQHRWLIPLVKSDDLGSVHAKLDWHQNRLHYSIRLSFFGDINIGERRNGHSGLEFYLTNVRTRARFVVGPTSAGGLLVKLSEDPERVRFPTSNSIIVEKVKFR